MLKWALAATALVAAAPAFADNWFLVSTATGNASAIFVDRDSIADDGTGKLRSTTYTVLAKDNDKGAAAFTYTADYDCAARLFQITHFTVADAAGKVIADQPGSGKWRPIDAGSQTAAMAQFTCSRGTQPGDARSFGSEAPFARARAMLKEQPAAK